METKPSSIPYASWRTLASGARQLVVHEALETIRSPGSSSSSLTPSTTMRSMTSFAGTVSSTFSAPPRKCRSSFSRERKTPVDSTTRSAPSFPHGIAAGSFSAVIAVLRPSTYRNSRSAETSPSNGPMTLSKRSR